MLKVPKSSSKSHVFWDSLQIDYILIGLYNRWTIYQIDYKLDRHQIDYILVRLYLINITFNTIAIYVNLTFNTRPTMICKIFCRDEWEFQPRKRFRNIENSVRNCHKSLEKQAFLSIIFLSISRNILNVFQHVFCDRFYFNRK